MLHNYPTMLIILDGFGVSYKKKYNAILQASTPNLTSWQHQYYYTTLQASGTFVGLQTGYHGNSQVGHFTLGAGKIIPQTATRLTTAFSKDELASNPNVTNLLKKLNPATPIHLMGMASDGKIHSNIAHAKACIELLHSQGFYQIYFHAFLDGRDVAPQSALPYLDQIQESLDRYPGGKIASVHGRFYAMDRDNNNDRTQACFDVLTQIPEQFCSYQDWITQNYAQNINDEFIKPHACIPDPRIKSGQGVIFFNFRSDRAIQLTKKLLTLDLAFLLTPVIYHDDLATTPLIPQITATNTLLEILSDHHKSLLTIAETEKYAHVTYFFNGHRYITWPGEQRILIPSKPLLPAQDPTMQAQKITQTVLASLATNPKDFYLINYANADMVGHSGNLPATIKAIECLDEQLGQLYEKVVVELGGTIYITADHGNAELMFDTTTGQACTSHTSNKVPFYVLTDHKEHLERAKKWQGTGLADIANIILKNLEIEI